MDTAKLNIKKVNIHGKGTAVYISKREREHIGIRKGEEVIIDMTIPRELKIMNINEWKKKYGGPEDRV